MLLISAGEKQRQEDSWAYRSGSVAHFVNHRPMGSFLSKKKKRKMVLLRASEIFLWPPHIIHIIPFHTGEGK